MYNAVKQSAVRLGAKLSSALSQLWATECVSMYFTMLFSVAWWVTVVVGMGGLQLDVVGIKCNILLV